MDAWTLIDLIIDIDEDRLPQRQAGLLLDALQRRGMRRRLAELEQAVADGATISEIMSAPIVPAAWEYQQEFDQMDEPHNATAIRDREERLARGAAAIEAVRRHLTALPTSDKPEPTPKPASAALTHGH